MVVLDLSFRLNKPNCNWQTSGLGSSPKAEQCSHSYPVVELLGALGSKSDYQDLLFDSVQHPVADISARAPLLVRHLHYVAKQKNLW